MFDSHEWLFQTVGTRLAGFARHANRSARRATRWRDELAGQQYLANGEFEVRIFQDLA
jgi:hypothetical protein